MFIKYFGYFLFLWYRWLNFGERFHFHKWRTASAYVLYRSDFGQYASGAFHLSVCKENPGMGERISPVIGKFFRFCLEKGEKKAEKNAGKSGAQGFYRTACVH